MRDPNKVLPFTTSRRYPMQSKSYDINPLGTMCPIGSGSHSVSGARRPEVFSYLFFMGLIASTFFI
jgi:hypothetical protein